MGKGLKSLFRRRRGFKGMRTGVSRNHLVLLRLLLAVFVPVVSTTGCRPHEETFVVELVALPGSPDPSGLADPKSVVEKLVFELTGQQPQIDEVGDDLYSFTVRGKLRPCAAARFQTPITRLEIVGSRQYVADNRPVPDDADLIITEKDLKSVYLEYNRLDRPEFVFEFTSDGEKRFEDYTESHVGDYVLFAFGGRVVNWVPIEGPVKGSQGIVEGRFNKEQALRYLLGLRMSMAGFRLAIVQEPWQKGKR
jgi:preprotein translocase subunit SecD